eukprot:362132-Chlamydomonas_euryale.AAC.4
MQHIAALRLLLVKLVTCKPLNLIWKPASGFQSPPIRTLMSACVEPGKCQALHHVRLANDTVPAWLIRLLVPRCTNAAWQGDLRTQPPCWWGCISAAADSATEPRAALRGCCCNWRSAGRCRGWLLPVSCNQPHQLLSRLSFDIVVRLGAHRAFLSVASRLLHDLVVGLEADHRSWLGLTALRDIVGWLEADHISERDLTALA